jgi:O-antigen/teichoic acid export membrane protein
MNNRVLKQAADTTGTKVLIFVCRLALVYCLAHMFSPEDFGAYSLLSAFSTFGAMLAGLNLYSYVYRQTPGQPLKERVVLFKTTFLFEIVLSTALVGVFLASGTLPAVLSVLKASNYAEAFVASLVLLIAFVASYEVQHYLWAKQEIGHVNRMDVITQVSWIPVLLCIWPFGMKITVTGLLLVQLVAVLCGTAFAFRRVELGLWWRVRPRLPVIPNALMFSIPMMIPGLSLYLLKLAERSFLSYYHSLWEVGLYSFACSFMNTLYSFSGLVVLTTMLPYLIEAHNRDDHRRRDLLLTLILKGSLIVFGVGAAILLTFSHLIVSLVGRPEYLPSSQILPLLALTFLMIILAYPAHYLLMLENRAVLLMGIDLAAVFIGLGLDVLLIPRYSSYGAAAASAVAFAAVAVMKIIFSRAWHHLLFREIISLRREHELVLQYFRSRKARLQPDVVAES